MVVLVLFGCIIYNSSISYNTSWMVMSLYIMGGYVIIHHGWLCHYISWIVMSLYIVAALILIYMIFYIIYHDEATHQSVQQCYKSHIVHLVHINPFDVSYMHSCG